MLMAKINVDTGEIEGTFNSDNKKYLLYHKEVEIQPVNKSIWKNYKEVLNYNSDKSKVILDYVITDKSQEEIIIALKQQKNKLLSTLKNNYSSILNNTKTYFYSNAINQNVNFGETHLENLKNLININNGNVGVIEFRTYENVHNNTTLESLKELQIEMINMNIAILNKKWEIENEINALTKDNIENYNIVFDISPLRMELI